MNIMSNNVSIIKANETFSDLLSEIAKITFIESHGSSAESEDINNYVAENYSIDNLKKELQDSANIYHILYYNHQIAGYSKIILNSPYKNSKTKNVSKLERIYLLKRFYNLGLGQKLFEFNVSFIKENKQTGIWLFVWKKNQRAITFYQKNGFVSIDSYDFKISKNHSNPNHLMFLNLK